MHPRRSSETNTLLLAESIRAFAGSLSRSRIWCFTPGHGEPPLQEIYRRDGRYRIFVHQAVLSGVIMAALETDEIQELPPTYNYPIHLHGKDITDHRPSSLEELVTIRHEGFYEDTEWFERIPAGEPLKLWLDERLL